MVLFKVPVEEKIPEPPKATKKPEPAVPPKEEPTKKEKGTFFVSDGSFLSNKQALLVCLLSFESVQFLRDYVTQITKILFNEIHIQNIIYNV